VSIGFSVIGSSGHAARVAAPAIAHSSRARLAAVVGSTQEGADRLASTAPDAKGYSDLDAMLADAAVQAVWVAGPNHLHADVAERCLDAGRHVLVEKPIATSAGRAAALTDLAQERGLQLGVDYQHRFRPGHRWMREAIAGGVVGTPHLVRIHRNWRYPYYPDMPASIAGSWRESAVDSGGWALNDIGSHLVDLSLWLVDEPGALAFARTANRRFTDVEAEDSAVLVIDAGPATVVIDTSNALDSFPGTVEIFGSDGWIRAEGTFDDEGIVRSSAGDEVRFATTAVEVYRACFEDFLDRIAGSPGVGATGRDATTTTEIIEAAVRGGRGDGDRRDVRA
jgi:1,5-anhydro-D-fructose reductase (1,5-anhydro-D-mannitol-forming)